MTPSPKESSPSLQRCLVLLADCLVERRDTITHLWIDGVRNHPEIPSARSLTFQQLSDHLPKLFDDMSAALRVAGGDEKKVERQTLSDARTHGLHRWEQDFRIDELLRELSLIRSLIMREGIACFLACHPDCGAYVEDARDVIIRFFEETSIGSVEQYIQEQQAQLEALNADLNRIDASRLRLMGTVAHELGNSVYSLKMIISALSTQGADSPTERQRALRLSESAFGEIQTFLTQLTDYSSLLAQPGVQWEEVDLRLLSEELGGIYRPAVQEAGLRFAIELEPALATVRSDRLKIKRVASNLITNAVKFRHPDRADGAVTLSFRSDGADVWQLAVEDAGIGIAPADRERVFDEFARLNVERETPGAGLGLAITKRLVVLLGGTIAVENGLKGGCRFVARLPRKPSGGVAEVA